MVIDTWATWCGPCIDQRPKMLEIAKKFQNNAEVAVLMVSVDASTDRWKKYIRNSTLKVLQLT